MRSMIVVCLVVAAGCDVAQQDVDHITCTDLCRCIGGLPSSQMKCEAGCTAQLAPVPDACAQCVAETTSSCTTMISDCIPLCTPQPTPLQGEP